MADSVHRFDPTTNGDVVFVELYNAIDDSPENETVKQVMRAVIRRTWCLQRLQNACTEEQSTDFASAFSTLSLAEDSTDNIADLMGGLSFPPDFQKELDDCASIIKTPYKEQKNVRTRVGPGLRTMIDATSYKFPKICVTKNLPHLAGMLLSISTDHYYSNQPSPIEQYHAGTFQLHVIAYLELCGGQLAMAETLTLPLASDLSHVVTVICNLHNDNWRLQARRGGLSPNLIAKGSWHIQLASDVSALKEDKWSNMTANVFADIKKQQDGLIFVAHTRQIEMVSAIEAKIKSLQLDGSKEWHTWGDGAVLNSEGALIPPPEYLPARAALPPSGYMPRFPVPAPPKPRPLTKDDFERIAAMKRGKRKNLRDKLRAKKQEARQKSASGASRKQRVTADPSSAAYTEEDDDDDDDDDDDNVVDDVEMEGQWKLRMKRKEGI